MIGKCFYQLMQLVPSPRDSTPTKRGYEEILYGVYDTWAGAKSDATDELRGSKWVIYRCVVVDTNTTGTK